MVDLASLETTYALVHLELPEEQILSAMTAVLFVTAPAEPWSSQTLHYAELLPLSPPEPAV